MFCQDGKPYLEINLTSENISDLRNFSDFCRISIDIIRYTSIPLGISIILLTSSAFIALKSRFKMTGEGTGVIFLAIIFLDLLNGLFCFRLFEQINNRDVITFNDTNILKLLEWATWMVLYGSWMLKFILCGYQILKFLKGNLRLVSLGWTPDCLSPNFSRQPTHISNRTGFLVVLFSMTWALLSMTIMYFLEKYYAQSGIEVPFLGIQTMVLFVGSWLVGGLYLFTRYDEMTSTLDRFITSTIGLNCLFTLLADALLTYGELSCIFHYPTPKYIKPMCFCLLARFLSYFDSMFFAAAQFRSSNVRFYFRKAVGFERRIPGTKHLEKLPTEEQKPLLEEASEPEDKLNSLPIRTEARNLENFRSVSVN